MAKDGRGLTPRYRQFVREYLVDLNATAAAERVGYSHKRIRQRAYELMQKPEIRDAIEEEMAKRAERTKLKADQVIEELAHSGFANMLDYMTVQSDGTAFVDLSKLTREQAAAIAEITVDQYTEGRGDDAHPVKRVRIKLNDKLAALTKLGDHLGMWKQRIAVGGDADAPPIKHAAVDYSDMLMPGEQGDDGDD